MKRREFLRTSALAASAAWLPFHRAWAADQPAMTLTGSQISLREKDIADLAASLQGELLLPTHARYEQARQVWNGSIDKRPALIASCVGASDVMHAVNFAREHKLLTAVRAGGHSTSGKSTCDGGIMIDLSPMRGVRVDPASRTAYLEPGTLLGQLDRECAAFGLATTAGTVSDTGAAGLTLGGGFGRLGSHFGLACDNLRGADVITASGKLVHTSEKENPELLWGLRGGGGNFGVVTSLEYRLHRDEPDGARRHARTGRATRCAEVLEFYADYASAQAGRAVHRSVPALRAGRGAWRVDRGVLVRGSRGRREGARAAARARAHGAGHASRRRRTSGCNRCSTRVSRTGASTTRSPGSSSVLTQKSVDTLMEVFRRRGRTR